jgi:two-component system sensor histidine kinase AdeS
MMWRHGLSRQILLSMIAVTLAASLVVFFGSYISYTLIMNYFPTLEDYDSQLPTRTDLLILTVLFLLALPVAGAIAFKLAARILKPLSSLAESARRIAKGDLTARAVPGDQLLGETAHLVADFNAMAQRLQDTTEGMIAWNAAIAHELRTPLTILKGRLQGVADGVFVLDETLIRNLLLQIDGLSRLVDDLRAVTLADSGRLELKMEPVPLAEEIRSIAGLVEPSFVSAGFSLELILADITIPGDGTRIRQALLALLENAQRYAKPGYIHIATRKSGSSVILSVEDAGPGLPAEFAQRAFDPFTRADPSRTRRLGGSGLGLSIVRAIAEAHGGNAAYRTSSRGGAVFEIILPLAR